MRHAYWSAFFRHVLVVLVLSGCAGATTPAPKATTNPPKATTPPEATNSPKATISPTVTVSPFHDLPAEYQRIQLPGTITDLLAAGGEVIPLPVNGLLVKIEADLAKALKDGGFDTTLFSLNRAAVYPKQSSNVSPELFKPDMVIAPVMQKYQKADFKNGLLVGVLWDINGLLQGGNKTYEVFFFEDRAELRDSSGKILFTRKVDEKSFVYAQQGVTEPVETLAFFVKGSCWGCWSIDDRCGCLICW